MFHVKIIAKNKSLLCAIGKPLFTGSGDVVTMEIIKNIFLVFSHLLYNLKKLHIGIFIQYIVLHPFDNTAVQLVTMAAYCF